MQIIARVHNDFPTKFGLPRQSGLVSEIQSVIVFEPEYRVPEALRGLEGYSHLWILWEFHQAVREKWSPTVRPPRLGGNTRMGVFATRSPFRPNPIGLSCVRLMDVRRTEQHGTVLVVSGADMMDGTPVYDVKPYLPYADCHPEATGGFAQAAMANRPPLKVEIPAECLARISAARRPALIGVLAQDPRPAYQDDPRRVYGLPFAGLDVRFTVADGTLTVVEVTEYAKDGMENDELLK